MSLFSEGERYQLSLFSLSNSLIDHRIFPRNTSIMAKKELKWTPLGPFMGFAGALFIDRGNSASAIRSLGEATDTMKRNGSSLWMFPEGTRSSSEIPSMLPLKKGGFHLAVQAGIPIVPAVVENYWWLYHPGIFGHGTIKVRGK
jgi:lysophosphatidate acyltransferase